MDQSTRHRMTTLGGPVGRLAVAALALGGLSEVDEVGRVLGVVLGQQAVGGEGVVDPVAQGVAQLGQPVTTATVGDKQIYLFKEWKITFIGGKVADIDVR